MRKISNALKIAYCLFPVSALAGITDIKFGQYQIADSQWNTNACLNTTTCVINSKNPGIAYKIPYTTGQLSWASGDYVQLSLSGNASFPYTATQYMSDGTVKVVLGDGKIVSMSGDFFFFVGSDNNTGQLFSGSTGMNGNAGVSWTGTLNPTIAQADAYASASYSLTPLAAGQSAQNSQTPPDIVAANSNPADIGTGLNPKFDGGTLRAAVPGATYSNNISITTNKGTIDQYGLTNTYSGVFSDDQLGSAGRLIIANSSNSTGGKIVLSNIANSYSGGTEVRAGATLSIADARVLGSGGLDLVGSSTVPATLETTANMTISAAITVSGRPVFSTANGTTLTVSNAIANGSNGSGDLVKEGLGTLSLSAANTYTGATSINAGTLNLTGSLASTAVTVAGGTLTNANGGLAAGTNLTVNSGAVNINANDTIANLNGSGGSVTLASGKTLEVSAGGAYAGTIGGAGTLKVSGGTQTLTGSNSHTGGTTVVVETNATTPTILSINSASALGSGTLALVGTSSTSATLQTTATMTIANAITVKNDPTFDVASGTTTTVSGVIADGGAAGYVTKIGDGTLALTAANTYTGPTSISAGTLALSGSGAIASSSAVSNSATFDVTGVSGNVAIKNYTQASGATLKMNISGEPASNQKVNVTGTSSLGGTLNLAAASGSYRPAKYTLMSSTGALSGTFSTLSTNLASVTNYDYSLGYDANNVYLYLRSTAADTLASIRAMGADLNKVYNAQYGIAQQGLSYDCRLFDANDLCLSTGARVTHSRADGSTYDGVALIAAYRAQPKLRVGGWIDQNESRQMALNVTAGNSTPMFGAFAVWNENPETRTGLEFKLSGAYGQKDLSLTRPVVGTSERGQGQSKLSTMVAEASVGYGIALDARTSISPFAGLRYASLSNKGYTEGSDVFSPLTFAKTSQTAKSVIAGVSLYDKPEGPIGLDLSAGVERYVSTSAAQISASGLDGLSAVQMTPVLSKNRPFASASLRYEIDKTQHLLFGLSHSKHFTNSDWVTSATVRYVIGL